MPQQIVRKLDRLSRQTALPFRVSFEFFPPKNHQGRNNLMEVARELNHFQPEFF